jgi:hypothetical protein
MKKIILFSVLISLSFVSCKKSSTSPDNLTTSAYFVKATVNGSNIVYTNYTGAVNKNVGLLNINGYNSDATATTDGISLTVYINDTSYYNNLPINVGTYTDTANYLRNLYNYWNPNNASITLQEDGTDYVNEFALDTSSSSPFVCTITVIDSVSISGTFSGKVYYGNNPQTAVAKIITNGSFYVPFQ